MSAGHGHKRPNLKHPAELKKLLAEGGAPELMQRWQSIDVDHDINDLAGYNIEGAVRYLDQDFVHAILDPDYAEEIGVGEIDTGLSPEDTIECILEHEGIEKVILDADNPVDIYLPAHEFATTGEHEKVRSKTGTDGRPGRPIKYERGLKAIIAWCARKVPKQVPADYACAPLLDDPDKNDLRVLKALRKLGVADAFKLGKGPVDYGKSTGSDQCAGCQHWQGDRGAELSPCALIAGLVRNTHWCRKFERADAEDGDDQAERSEPGDVGAGGVPAEQASPLPDMAASDSAGGGSAPPQPE